MTTSPLRAAAAVALALLLAACADRAGGGGAPEVPSPEPDAGPATVVLQVSEVGGFTTPALLAGRVPTVTVYADGRLITDGPVIAIWPAPALPNLQLYRLDDGGVRELVEQALAAGVAETGDLGEPSVADVTTTRVTVRTGGETVTREAYGLGIVPPTATDGSDAPMPGMEAAYGLTDEQIAARARLSQFVDALRNPAETLGPERVSGPEPYAADAVAALVEPSPEQGPEPAQPTVPWPGPPLPGEPIGPGVTCVTATGEVADAVLSAATNASSATPWTTEDGTRWSVVLRPLLPHESGCADLLAG
jgi:hypothetical protein